MLIDCKNSIKIFLSNLSNVIYKNKKVKKFVNIKLKNFFLFTTCCSFFHIILDIYEILKYDILQFKRLYNLYFFSNIEKTRF